MKYWIVPAVFAMALCAACESPTEDSPVGEYVLVEYLGRLVPAPVSVPTGECADTVLSGSVAVLTATSASWIMNEVSNCAGQRLTSRVERQGTYETIADTLRFVWRIENDPLLSHFAQDGIIVGSQLHFVTRVYTEADPNGTQAIWAKFQRR